ncbi:SPOR domain-containing protein [Yoonia sp. R2331]|uniref:SPOR domain-containing protein n=1 Tax=Yoonia sp. R2331 TaxID=3237238 RepID=UPI0034E58894
MSGDVQLKTGLIRLSAAAFVVIGLAACDEQGKFQMPSLPNFGGDGAAAEGPADPAAPLSAGPTVERDVEAPEVFSVSENGLWDGRPSLGGVWVAHPDASGPERVIIRNPSNDKFVIGALFRRERENPGPALQVSSDAAEELGMLAGAPQSLSVIALRREEGPAEVAAAVTDFDNPVEITAEPLDPVAGAAAAAIETAELAAAAPTPAPAPAPAPAPTSSLEKPFIQIGIFSIEANATRTADRLRGDGLSARVLSQQSQGKSFWRVIVGPAPNAADRAAVLAKVKALGFGDAYFVTN